MTNPVTVQHSFRLRNDDGNETGATWVAALNTNANAFADRNYRIRYNIRETNARAFTLDARLEYNRNAAGWNAVNASSSVVRSSASTHFADGDNTTEQLAGPGTFTAGKMEEADGQAAAIGINNQDTEVEHCFQVRSADVASGDTIQLRITDAGTTLTTYTATITLTVKIARTLAADGSSYSVSGTAASLEYGREVAADGGSYVLSGTAATLYKSTPIAAGSGSYAITGTAAGLRATFKLVAEGGSYSVSGTAASLEYGREVVAGEGSYAISGTAASLEFGAEVAAASGSLSLTGSDASLEYGRVLAAAAGSYAISGTAASLEKGSEVAAGSGSYTLTGSDATLTVAGALTHYTIAAESGSYAVSGAAADLSASVSAPIGRALNLPWPIRLPVFCFGGPIVTREEWGRWVAELVVEAEAETIVLPEEWGFGRSDIGAVLCEGSADLGSDAWGKLRGARQPDIRLAILAMRGMLPEERAPNRRG